MRYLGFACAYLLVGWAVLGLFVAIFFVGNLASLGMWCFAAAYAAIGLALCFVGSMALRPAKGAMSHAP
jgi:hypothetical protein